MHMRMYALILVIFFRLLHYYKFRSVANVVDIDILQSYSFSFLPSAKTITHTCCAINHHPTVDIKQYT